MAAGSSDAGGGHGPIRRRADGVELDLRVTPRGGRDALEGLGEDAAGRRFLKARVRAAPEEGAANAALLALLARRLGLKASALAIARGAQARLKTVRIEGPSAALALALEALIKEGP